MATIDIGKLAFTHKGDYAGGTAYVANDVVYYNGSAYIAKQSTTGNLPTDTNNWNVFTAGSGGIFNSSLSLGSSGQILKSDGSNLVFGADAGGGVKQVKQGTKTDVQSVYNGSNVMIGAVATITPTNANNKILIQTSGSLAASTSTTMSIGMRFAAGGTVSNSSPMVDAIGDADGNRSRAMFSGSCNPNGSATWFGTNFSYQYLHAPNTTSATQYQLCALAYDQNVYHYINRSSRDSNDAQHWRTPHTIVLTEIDSSVL